MARTAIALALVALSTALVLGAPPASAEASEDPARSAAASAEGSGEEPPSRRAGAIASFEALFAPDATLLGGVVTGFVHLRPLFALELASGALGRRTDDAAYREFPLALGGRFVLTPDAQVRVSVPFRTGFALRRVDPDAAASRRFALYTLDLGVSAHVALAEGPVHVGATARGRLEVAPSEDALDFSAAIDVDLAFIF